MLNRLLDSFLYGPRSLIERTLVIPVFLVMTAIGTSLVASSVMASNPTSQSALQNYAGQWLYIDFWASWCAPCQASFPFMNKLQRKFQSQNFSIVAINVDEDPAQAQRFLQHTPANFPIVFDPKGTLPAKFQVKAMPTSFLIDPNGNIVWQHQGFLPKDAFQIEQLIQQKLRGQ